MSTVTITVNNRNFTIACEDGQEDRVRMLGNYINEKFASIASSGAASNEVYSLVLTSLVLTDELFDLKAEMAQAPSQELAAALPSADEIDAEIERRVADRLLQEADVIRNRAKLEVVANENKLAETVDNLAEQIEHVVKRLKKA